MSSNHDSINLLALISAMMGSFLIGCSPILVRATDLGPLATAFYRILFALPLLYLWMRAENSNKQNQPQKLNRRDMIIIALAGIFFAIDLAFWNWSLDYTAIVNATVLNNTAAFFVPFIIWFVYKKAPSPSFLVAVGIGFSGCVVLSGANLSFNTNTLLGDLSAITSGLFVALYVVTIQNLRQKIGTGRLMYLTSIVSVIALFFFVVFFKEPLWPLTQIDWLTLLGLSILIHAGGQGLLAQSMGKVPANYVALIMLLCPVTAAVLGWLIYEEALSQVKIAGIALVLASIMAVNTKRRKKKIQKTPHAINS